MPSCRALAFLLLVQRVPIAACVEGETCASPRLRRGVVPGSPTQKRKQLPSVGMVRVRRELQVLRFSPSESSRHAPQSIAILRSEQHHTPGSPLMSTKIFGSEMATNRLEDQELAMLSSIWGLVRSTRAENRVKAHLSERASYVLLRIERSQVFDT